jgi:hypothetical protein
MTNEYRIEGKRAYLRAIRRSLNKKGFKEAEQDADHYLISTSKVDCDYCIEFRNFKSVDFFNKVLTTKKLADCEYYPPSEVIKDQTKWNKFTKKLNPNKYYYIKPKYGAQCKNISILKGKEVIIDNGAFNSFPFAIQEEITPKLDDGRKVDYRTFVLYVKEQDMVNAYYSPEHLKRVCSDKFEERTRNSFFSFGEGCEQLVVKNTTEQLEQCLKSAQKYILPKFDNKNASKVEYFLVGYDIIEDVDGKFWIMEINSDPNFFHYDCEKHFHQHIFRDIAQSIVEHQKTQELKFNYFLPLTLPSSSNSS